VTAVVVVTFVVVGLVVADAGTKQEYQE